MGRSHVLTVASQMKFQLNWGNKTKQTNSNGNGAVPRTLIPKYSISNKYGLSGFIAMICSMKFVTQTPEICTSAQTQSMP